MASAAIRSREACHDTQWHVEMRQRRHDRFAHGLDRLEARVQEPQPTLEELTQAVFALRQELTQGATEGLVEQTHRATLEQHTAVFPPCGHIRSARGSAERTVETWVGAMRHQRPYFYGARAQLGSVPLAAVLGLTGRRKPSAVQTAAVQLTQEMLYETACELVEEWTGLSVSAHPAHAVTQESAEGLTVLAVAPSQKAIAATIAAVAARQKWRPMLVLALDGADVPTRPETAQGGRRGRKKSRAKRARWTGAGREAKGCRGSLSADERIVQVLSWPQVQTDVEVAEALRQVKTAGLMPEAQIRLWVLADGAPWLWKQGQALCPLAVERLDYAHGCEHLHKVAVMQYGDHPERPQAWYEAAGARLFWGEAHGVIWGLQRMQPTEAQAAEELTQLMGY
jgi:hypothetical protein